MPSRSLSDRVPQLLEIEWHLDAVLKKLRRELAGRKLSAPGELERYAIRRSHATIKQPIFHPHINDCDPKVSQPTGSILKIRSGFLRVIQALTTSLEESRKLLSFHTLAQCSLTHPPRSPLRAESSPQVHVGPTPVCPPAS